MAPKINLQRWNDGRWTVFEYGKGHVAETNEAESAVAVMRLLGGLECITENIAYLRGIGCRPGGHECLDALLRHAGEG